MIIDIRREMSDAEHEKYLSVLVLRDNETALLNQLEAHLHDDDDKYFLDLTYDELDHTETEHLEELQHRVDECIHKLVNEGWIITNNHIQSTGCIFWAERQNIPYTVVYDIRYYNDFSFLLKQDDEYHDRLYQAKFRKNFYGGITLLQHGWIKERSGSEKETKWAIDELGDDFLYDYRLNVYYFRPEAAMAFKLRWT